MFFIDNIIDIQRNREKNKSTDIFGYGSGYLMFVAWILYGENLQKYEVINHGIGGNRVVDLYARIKSDVWNLQPDALSILIGINDVVFEIYDRNGVEIDRFEKDYRMMIRLRHCLKSEP